MLEGKATVLETLLETKIDPDYIFHRYYTVIKFYCGFAVLQKVIHESELGKIKSRNLRYDIYLDANIPDSKTLRNLHEKLLNNESVKISEPKTANTKFKIVCLGNDTGVYFTKEEAKGFTKIFLNHTRIIDEILEENWDKLYNGKSHPNFTVPIYDLLFKKSKEVIKELIENNI